MTLLQQLVQFLSQPPESLVYHLITLLALQATFWLALWQLRRQPADAFARRLVWASGGIMLGRLIVLFASLVATNPTEAASIIPPLERAVDTAGVILLVWALSPQPHRYPHLGDVLLLILLIFTGFMYAFFAQDWLIEIEAGAPPGGYSLTMQATLWEILQLIILTIGGILIIIGKESEWTLRLSVLGILFLAHVFGLFNQPSGPSTPTDIAYWTRLGNLIAYPLLAILTYRHNLSSLLPSRRFSHSDDDQFGYLLQLSQETVHSVEIDDRLNAGLKMAFETVEAEFVGLAITDNEDSDQLNLTWLHESQINYQQIDRDLIYQHYDLDLNDLPSFRQSIRERRQIELLSVGKGARQLHNLFQNIGAEGLGSLFIQPLFVDDQNIGLLLFASPKSSDQWLESEKEYFSSLGGFVAQILYNAQQLKQEKASSDKLPAKTGAVVAGFSSVRSSESELDLDDVESARATILFADKRELDEQEEATTDDQIQQLEEEIVDLRDALTHAEETLALAAAGEAGLSTDWIMRTVSRYSGELEQSQARISQLEDQLRSLSKQHDYNKIINRVSELRTPLTSLEVYTDLLLNESMGILGSRQMNLARRMKESLENISESVDEIIVLAEELEPSPTIDNYVDVQGVIESAINSVSALLSAKNLMLDLEIESELPALPSTDDTIYHVIVNLLKNACAISVEHGRIGISAHQDTIPLSGSSEPEEAAKFLRIVIRDNGIEESQRLYSFLHTTHPLAASEPEVMNRNLADVADRLARTKEIAQRNGGRVWLENEPGVGNNVTVLLPVPNIISSGTS